MGPTLGSILLLSATSSTLGQGVVLLLAYALGLGVPFLIAACAIGGIGGFVRRLTRWYGVIGWLAGALLVAMGVMVYQGTFVQLARLFPVGL
jgi:cytochrome c-type biogenesis protein